MVVRGGMLQMLELVWWVRAWLQCVQPRLAGSWLSRKRHLLFKTDTNNKTVISEGCRHRRPSVESNYYVVKKPRK